MPNFKNSITMDSNPEGKNQFTGGGAKKVIKGAPVREKKESSATTPSERMTKHLEKNWSQSRNNFVKTATTKHGATEKEAHEHYNKFNKLPAGSRHEIH